MSRYYVELSLCGGADVEADSAEEAKERALEDEELLSEIRKGMFEVVSIEEVEEP